MITLTISANGQIQAYCEASGPDDRGYYLDLPDDGDGFKRELFKALARRQCRFNEKHPLEAVDASQVLKWLTDHPPSPAAATSPGRAPKPVATMADLKGLRL